RRGIPLDVDTAGKSISDRRPFLYLRLLTERVRNPLAQICSHSSLIHRFGHSAQPLTAPLRLNRFAPSCKRTRRTSNLLRLTTALRVLSLQGRCTVSNPRRSLGRSVSGSAIKRC